VCCGNPLAPGAHLGYVEAPPVANGSRPVRRRPGCSN
jgi:hypothetical protein